MANTAEYDVVVIGGGHNGLTAGAYLSRDTDAGNPGRGYVRVALVGPAPETEDALTRIRDTLYGKG